MALAVVGIVCAVATILMFACSCDVDTESTSHTDNEMVAHEQAPLDVTPYNVPDYARGEWAEVKQVTDLRTNQRWWLLRRVGSYDYSVMEVRGDAMPE